MSGLQAGQLRHHWIILQRWGFPSPFFGGIEHDGTARDVVVHRSSGKPSLDRAATRAVAAAVPLPWVYGRLEVPVRFELSERR